MNQATYLNNQFIIAMPNLADPAFFHTVTYLCQHNAEGALGIVINRPAEMKLGEIFKQMNITVTSPVASEVVVFIGGPVHQERGFVLHTTGGNWDASMAVSDSISLTTSRDVIEAIAEGKGPKHYLVALGYAGWGEGQLEQEMLANAWLSTPNSQDILFDTPINARWQAAAKQIGIDINQLTTPAGHG
ncbi:YqgE/AlgH family protein [Methylobacter sp. S3L5C]|uniref:YqgE/AlgH family protein n=1 Tax=Methylobacter sp. S3L5C TaxID=2839024 RepID=UPI001FAC44AD|nr:YqgE/AlgH family protein [Methylobacter sp. S3L5C]UOA09449.1 YqgE/AlgH family protein [Methylobacter sp. S3L5C]